MKSGYFGAAILQERVEVATAGAIHELHGHFQLTLFYRVKINQLSELFEIIRLRIERFAFVGSNDRAFEAPVSLHQFLNILFDFPGNFRLRRSSVARGKFQTLVFGWIVARRHINSTTSS